MTPSLPISLLRPFVYWPGVLFAFSRVSNSLLWKWKPRITLSYAAVYIQIKEYTVEYYFSNKISATPLPPRKKKIEIESCLTIVSGVEPSDPISSVCDCLTSKTVIVAIKKQTKKMYCCSYNVWQWVWGWGEEGVRVVNKEDTLFLLLRQAFLGWLHWQSYF